jgi:hypothetical protein
MILEMSEEEISQHIGPVGDGTENLALAFRRRHSYIKSEVTGPRHRASRPRPPSRNATHLIADASVAHTSPSKIFVNSPSDLRRPHDIWKCDQTTRLATRKKDVAQSARSLTSLPRCTSDSHVNGDGGLTYDPALDVLQQITRPRIALRNHEDPREAYDTMTVRIRGTDAQGRCCSAYAVRVQPILQRRLRRSKDMPGCSRYQASEQE